MKKLLPIILIISVLIISGCANTQTTTTKSQGEIKTKVGAEITSYCAKTKLPPPCAANDTVITETQEPTPTSTTSLPPTLPTTSATPTSTISASPTATVIPSSSASPTSTADVKQFGCCVVCRVENTESQTGYTFFPADTYTMTKVKCDSYNQGTDAFAGHYFWGEGADICPIKGPPVQEYEIGSEIDNIDIYKFCAAFGKVPPQ